MAALCDWYLEEAKAGRILGRRNRPIKASTLVMHKSRIETHIKPLLGKALVHTLKIADIERMQSGESFRVSTKPGQSHIARRSDLIALVPRSRIRDGEVARPGLEGFDLPVSTPELAISVMWQPRLDADPAHRWLRQKLVATCRAAA